MEVCAVTMTKVEDWLETIPSKNTRKNYVNGIFEIRDLVWRQYYKID